MKIKFLAALVLLAVVFGITATATAAAAHTHPASSGLIDAHDGMVVHDPLNDTNYMVGTSYGCGFTFASAAPSPYCGVRIYSSRGLNTWAPAGVVNNGYAFNANTAAWQAQCNSVHFGCFRPKLLRNAATGRWVMWLNDPAMPFGYAVLTSSSPTGPFVQVKAPVLSRPALFYGDEDVYQDGDSGDAYIAYTVVGAGNSHQIAVQKLDPTWTTGFGHSVTAPPTFVESPGLFHRGHFWYLTYSDPACPYCNNAGTSYAMSTSPLGPWTVRGQISVNSCGGQPAGVDVIGDRFIWQVDQWQQLNGSFNPNQAAAPTYMAALSFLGSGGIAPQPCR